MALNGFFLKGLFIFFYFISPILCYLAITVNSTLDPSLDPRWSINFTILNDTLLSIEATLPIKSYLAIGFGTSMYESDMITLVA